MSIHNARELLAVDRIRFRYLRGVGDKIRMRFGSRQRSWPVCAPISHRGAAPRMTQMKTQAAPSASTSWLRSYCLAGRQATTGQKTLPLSVTWAWTTP